MNKSRFSIIVIYVIILQSNACKYLHNALFTIVTLWNSKQLRKQKKIDIEKNFSIVFQR